MVAVGQANSQSGCIKYSTDGSNWSNSVSDTFITPGNPNSLANGIAYGNGLWVAVGRGNGISPTTTILYGNGSNWSNSASGGFNGIVGQSVTYGNGLWVAVGNGSILYSTDGSNWSNSVSGGFTANYGFGIAYRPSLVLSSILTVTSSISGIAYTSTTLNVTQKFISNLMALA
jgi:hypothetical protein